MNDGQHCATILQIGQQRVLSVSMDDVKDSGQFVHPRVPCRKDGYHCGTSCLRWSTDSSIVVSIIFNIEVQSIETYIFCISYGKKSNCRW